MLGSYKPQAMDTSHREAENALLQNRSDSLRSVVNHLQSEIEAHHATIDSLQHLIAQNTSNITQNRIEHEKEIVRIADMPDDELFRFFTDYLAR